MRATRPSPRSTRLAPVALTLSLLAGCVHSAPKPAADKTAPIFASTTTPGGDPFTMFRAEGAPAMLGKIQRYLTEKELKSSLEADGDDSTLTLAFENDDTVWRLLVGVFDSGGAERAVSVRLRADFYVDADKQGAEVMAILNQHHRDVWGGTFMLDDDGEILGRWPLNFPTAAGLHASYVHDVIVRLGMAWKALRESLLGGGIVNTHADE